VDTSRGSRDLELCNTFSVQALGLLRLVDVGKTVRVCLPVAVVQTPPRPHNVKSPRGPFVFVFSHDFSSQHHLKLVYDLLANAAEFVAEIRTIMAPLGWIEVLHRFQVLVALLVIH
jgi:hypothetical protein